jgi:hypothetical protein
MMMVMMMTTMMRTLHSFYFSWQAIIGALLGSQARAGEGPS